MSVSGDGGGVRTVEIGLLGAVEVTVDGASVSVGGHRLRAAFARLALDAGRMVTVSTLVDAVWGDDPPAGSGNALQSLVSRLRRTLPAGVVESAPAGYRLAVAPESVDVHRFERLAAAGRRTLESGDPAGAAETLREALSLWRGPALADIGDAPFRAAVVTRLENARLAAIEDRIDADLALDRHPEVVAELEELTAEHPLRERLHAQLVLALNGASRQADALTAFDRIRRRLADELGVDPGAVLKGAYTTVLGSPGVPAKQSVRMPAAPRPVTTNGARTRGNLRPQLTTFVGRRTELAAVADLLAAERLVTLIGPGGAGKTRLAEESGARLTDRNTGGVWMVPLAPIGEGDEVPQAVLTGLGRRQVGLLDTKLSNEASAPQDVDAILVKALSAGPTLLVLDNCEHLLEPIAALAHSLLLDCPELRILATSREPLGVPGERLHPVPSLALPPPGRLTPAQAARYPAVQLLVDRAASVRPGFALTPENVDAIVEICRSLDGMPLALELAAPRLRSLSPEQLAARLGDRFRLLTAGSRTALPRHQTLHAVVAWSWELLTAQEQVLWRRLSQFPGGATVDAAERVCADDDLLRPGDVLETLASLVDKSLVELVAEAEPPRYRMLETVRAFGAEQLETAGETAATRDALLAYFVELVETAEPKLRSPEQRTWANTLTAEYENITAALRWAVDQGRGDPAVRLVAGLAWYWALRGAHAEADRWATAVLPLADQAPPVSAAIVTAFAGLTAASLRSTYEEAKREAERVTELIKPFATAPDAHPVLVLADSIIHFLGDRNDQVQEKLERVYRHPDPWVSALALFLDANLHENDGDLLVAEQLFESARSAFESIGDRWGRGAVLSSLASIKALRGDHRGAIEALEQARALIYDLNGFDDLPRVLLWLALEWARIGDFERARAYLDESTTHVARLGDDDNAVGFLGAARSTVLRLTGDLTGAAALLTTEIERYRAHPYGPPQIYALLLADYTYALVAVGEAEQAVDYVLEALSQAAEAHDSPVLGGSLDTAAAVALALGDPAGAAQLLGAAALVRGLPDLGNPDVVRTRELAAEALGPSTFEARYRDGETMPKDDVLDLARELLTQVRRR
ncbi:putative ATPase [Cryptosporangium arvum DSM 44712]|uniref:Putative ATPase n=1 Tax=Cryptosporangium arvum DSM 44712 TaxID=927661 RepID=A0A010YGZ4_9ACTN|nr:putative ATPase [Cryptosporangium arvum DSM 44712]